MKNKKDKDNILGIIQKSGNDLHFSVSNIIRKEGWKVRNSPYYNDPATSIAREIDIIADKEYPIEIGPSGKKLEVRLIIECSYICNPVVFWFEPKNIEEAKRLSSGNFPVSVKNRDDFYSGMAIQSQDKVNHYIKRNEAAKLYDKDKKGGKDEIFDALNKALKAQVFFEEHQLGGYYSFTLPIIIVNSYNDLKRRAENKSGYESIQDAFQIEVDNYSYLDKNKESAMRYFLIDVVSSGSIADFLKELEENDIKMWTGMLAQDIYAQKYQARLNRIHKENKSFR